jgi:putative Ca2+/H+ antiporter (TMEM165/GDT1 family)
MLSLFFIAYGTIFVSELIGDKNIYTISSLATRFGPFQVFCGFTAAFAIKTLIAILHRHILSYCSRDLVQAK